MTGQVRIPPGARVVDATGKYLIPGLWDMHAHIFTHRGDAFFPLYAVAGVTAVRDMHTVVPMAEIQERRKRLADGTLIGPRLIAVAGPLIAGPAGGGRFPPQSVVGTPAEARAAVIARKQMGVDFIKPHGGLSRELLLAIADEAKRQGLPVAGHAPGPPEEASDAGLRSIEHNTGVRMSSDPRAAELRKQNAAATPEPGVGFVIQNLRRRARATFDEQTAQRSSRSSAPTTRGWCPRSCKAWYGNTWPTARCHTRSGCATCRGVSPASGRARPDSMNPSAQDLVEGNNDLRIVDRDRRRDATRGAEADGGDRRQRAFPVADSGHQPARGAETLRRGGIHARRGAAGGDPRSGPVPGREKDFGTVEQGKVADLVLLDADPLADIRNTQKIQRGHAERPIAGPEALDEMQSRLEASAPNQ